MDKEADRLVPTQDPCCWIAYACLQQLNRCNQIIEELGALVEKGRLTPCRVIDLGCGTGSNAVFLAQRGFQVTGVDYAASAIEKARRKAEAAGVTASFVVDDLTQLQKIKSLFDLRVDYGTLDDLHPKNREKYVRNILPLTHARSQFLLWCFEWQLLWWERLLLKLAFFGAMALEPGEVERRFSDYFQIERIAGATSLSGWPRGFAAYLMTRKAD